MDNQNNLLSAGELLGNAWAMYKDKAVVFAQIMVAPFLLTVVDSMSSKGSDSIDFKTMDFSYLGFYLILLVVFIIVSTLANIALLYSIKNSIDNQPDLSLKSAYSLAWKKMLSYWWVSFLVGVITIIGLILLIVPGLIFSIWFCLAPFVLISEDLRGMDALNKSKEYVKGRWGKVFLRVLCIGGVALVVSLITSVVLMISKTLGVVVSDAVSGLVLTPLIMTYMFLLYNNLKATKNIVTESAPVSA